MGCNCRHVLYRAWKCVSPPPSRHERQRVEAGPSSQEMRTREEIEVLQWALSEETCEKEKSTARAQHDLARRVRRFLMTASIL